jgi:hypothetical protein
MSFAPRTRTLRGEFAVGGAVDSIFRLFSPLGEKSWVPGWDPELLHPKGVTWGQGLLFRTKEEKGDAIWIVSQLDRSGYRVEYHRVEPNRYVARVEVCCRALSATETEVRTAYEFIGLSREGNEEIATMTEDDYKLKMERWRSWITAYLERGRR